MNSLVKVPPYSKLNFPGKIFFTQNWCNITLNHYKGFTRVCLSCDLESDKNLVRRYFDIPIELNMSNIVFITNVNEYPFEIIEFVMLFTKYYIHCCKWSNNLTTIEVLKARLNSREKMERSNSICKDKLRIGG